jgi:hypothetical protein
MPWRRWLPQDVEDWLLLGIMAVSLVCLIARCHLSVA